MLTATNGLGVLLDDELLVNLTKQYPPSKRKESHITCICVGLSLQFLIGWTRTIILSQA